MKRIIYYHPHSIAENPSKGSELRPKKMKEAFQNIGYEVDLVAGDSQKRKTAINKIKEGIKEGISYDFLYAESSNMPIPLTDSHHVPVRPLLDFRFFRFLNRKDIPVGFFYRDLYWRVDELKKKVSYLKFLSKQMFHWMEWYGVTKTVDHLFVPTKKMSKYFPSTWPEENFSALYPGCDLLNSNFVAPKKNTNDSKLKLLYVGGVEPPYYDLIPLIEVVNELSGLQLLLCCRNRDWEKNSHYYSHLNFDNITVIHADSNQIVEYYKEADVFFDIRKPEGYLKNTIPIKVIESIGYEVPLLLSEGTESADFVKSAGVGWVVETSSEAERVLKELRDNRSKVTIKIEEIREANKKHTWEARAQEASDILTQKKLSN